MFLNVTREQAVVSGRLLQCLAKEITPVAHYIFTLSLCTGELPTEHKLMLNLFLRNAVSNRE